MKLLEAACSSGNVEVLLFLTELGVDLSLRNRFGSLPIEVAAENGHIEIVDKLLDALPISDFSNVDDAIDALHSASKGGQLDMVKHLLDAGVNIEGLGKTGTTVLMEACERGDSSFVRYLVENGAKIDAITGEGQTVAMFACNGGNLEVVRYLHYLGADLNASMANRQTAIMFACQQANFDVLDFLHENGADLNGATLDGKTVVMFACQGKRSDGDIERQLKVLSYLYGLEVNLDASTRDGMTAAMFASRTGNFFVLKSLYENGADLKAIMGDGEL